MFFTQSISDISFVHWLRSNRENRWLLGIAGLGILIQFIIFKYLYPFPNFIPPDSYSYIQAAADNEMINLWAIGYSKFLRIFSTVESSDVVLVWFQYLFLQSSILYFLFTLRYLLSPGRWLFRILLIISLFNPLIPHISNFVSSDCLFTTLALIWFTQLFWILYRPKLSLFIAHAGILLFAFMVRYNALYFPIISIILIAFSHVPARSKWMGIGIIVVLLGGFIARTELAYSQQTGTRQFSAFGGWQMAANALYGYAYAKPDPPEKVPVEFRKLQAIVNRHMDSIRRFPDSLRPDRVVYIYYLWDFKSPIRQYMDSVWKKDTTGSYFKHYSAMAPLYAAYGKYLMLHHPLPFLRYYMWANFIRYYVPPPCFMESYILGNAQVDTGVAKFFKWKSRTVKTRTKDRKIWITDLFPIPMAIINVGYVLCFIGFVFLGAFKQSSPISRQILLLMLVVWTSSAGFSVFAAPIELRYQLFPMIITVVFGGLLLGYLIEKAKDE
jgi:hypothetical protein